MFKKLFILLFQLITAPTQTWETLSEEQLENNEEFQKSYFFPIVGIIALLAFAGLLLSDRTFTFQAAMKEVIKQVLIYGGSFYLISFIFSEYVFPRFDVGKNKLFAERFTGYASSLVYVVAMVETLFPYFLMKILIFYTVYIVWTGGIKFLGIEEKQWIKFTIFASLLILAVPVVIEGIIYWLMPGLGA
ncbi:hypothetical protein AGMMS50262_03590 [Bacteroidia bacterium]|nr:hypothetical protein AGMMS50262_03590 [Bacteroidia bacterium]